MQSPTDQADRTGIIGVEAFDAAYGAGFQGVGRLAARRRVRAGRGRWGRRPSTSSSYGSCTPVSLPASTSRRPPLARPPAQLQRGKPSSLRGRRLGSRCPRPGPRWPTCPAAAVAAAFSPGRTLAAARRRGASRSMSPPPSPRRAPQQRRAVFSPIPSGCGGRGHGLAHLRGRGADGRGDGPGDALGERPAPPPRWLTSPSPDHYSPAA